MNDFLTIETELNNIKRSLYYLVQKGSNVNGIISLLIGNYQMIGLIELMNEDNRFNAKKYLYKSAKVEELQFKVAKGLLPKIEIDKPTIWGTLYKTIGVVLLSDSVPLLYSFFEVIDDVGGDEVRKGYHYNTAYAIKYLVLGNRDKSRHYLELAQKAADRKKAKTETGYSDVVEGILDSNPELISQGIEKNLKYHHRCETGIFKAFCLEATAMVKLAKMYGFEVSTDSSYIHQGLLQHDPDIVFEDIDEVYEALGITKT
ncbi:hypothetical protein [Runella zeae]|uniref:hypothetical protein n=1 Tax=Runella zeae TaxID=94255 RepID=UPI00048D31A2|nr:hypothetical protein [Runella zeae]